MSQQSALPDGFRIAMQPDTGLHDAGRIVWGGAPFRLLRLSDAGANVVRRLAAGVPVSGSTAGLLARRLVEADLAFSIPAAPNRRTDVHVVVPVRDRAEQLEQCLTALAGLRVTVVDDGSVDPVSVAAVAKRHRAKLVVLDTNVGPAGARNAGVDAVTAPIVVFVDSDCVIDADSVRRLAAHLADPAVAAVAPRIRPREPNGSALARFASLRSPLDLGSRSATVRPAGRVPYVPTTVLAVRRFSFQEVGGFDESLRYGEDVDLVWRLVDQGWSVRYDASIVAGHDEPSSWREWIGRRHHYGTSAGPLSVRHGHRVGGPPLAGLAAPLRVGAIRDAGMPRPLAARLAREVPGRTLDGLVRWAGATWAPPLATVAALTDWVRRRPDVDPLRWTAAYVVDSAAYGTGVWRGCVAERTVAPLLPRRVSQ